MNRTEPPLSWGAEALWEQLTPLLPGISVEVVACMASTNTALLERARVETPAAGPGDPGAQVRRSLESTAFGRRAADLQPCLLVAEHQTHGRGRQGRTWQAAPGASLTFSLALPLAPHDWSGLSLAVGVAIADALDPLREGAPPRLGVKWPNDLLILDGEGARKLGGILIETVAAGERRLAVIGIGLNVLPLTDPGADGFASVRELDPQATAPSVLAQIARPLAEALQRFEHDGFAGAADAFARRDVLRGRAVRTTHPAAPEGISRGVSARGALQVERPDGTLHEVDSGEVSVRLQGGGAAC